MQPSGMSFDLLNHRSSFLNTSTSGWSFIEADPEDDTFDFTKEKTRTEEDALKHTDSPAANVDEDTLDLTKERKRM